MPSLYRRLFTYRERPERSPLEDFLTEAVVDLFNRMPSAAARRLVSFLIADDKAIADLGRIWTPQSQVRWTSQVVIDERKVIDVVFEIDGHPVIVIENKVAAGFQTHKCLKIDRATGKVIGHKNQLASYGQWLSKNTVAGWGGAIVLLTHWTAPPPDFAVSQAVYGCAHRAVIRWSDLSRWLFRTSRESSANENPWSVLAKEFVEFLKENDMDSELATGQDFAALQIYLASADRIRNTVEQIWEGSREYWRPLCQQTAVALEISTEYGCWKYRYLSRREIRGGYVGFGIRFPDLSDHLNELVDLKTPYIFVELAAEGDAPVLGSLSLSSHWRSGDEAHIAVKPISSFSPESDLFVAEGMEWAKARFKEVMQAIG